MGFFPEILQQSLSEAIESRKERRRLWTLRSPESFAGTVDFISNDFLSLNSGVHREETLREIERNPNFKVGAGSSRVADGGSEYTFHLERWLADFHSAESCLLFSSGFEANVAVFTVVPRPGDIILYDSKIHASVHDGMRNSRAALIKPFEHNDPSSLKDILLKILEDDSAVTKGQKTVFVAIESIYSMDGDISPASEIVQCVKECLPLKNAVLVVDEAHSNGVMGPQGKGFICDLGLENEFLLRVHTFGKGINATGAVVLCPQLVKDSLVNYARNFIFTTGPAFLTMATVKASYNIISSAEGDERRERLQKRVRQFYLFLTGHVHWAAACKTGRLRVTAAETWQKEKFLTPIIPLLTKSGLSRNLEDRLTRCGFLTLEVGFPVVPKNQERVRVIVHADNTEQEIDRLVDTVVNWALDLPN